MIRRIAATATTLLAGQLLDSAVDYLKHHDSEHTRREYVKSRRDALITALNNQRDFLIAYFEQRFAERREALQHFYDLLHTAVDNKDTAQLQAALLGFLGIIQDNPLADLAEFRVQWNNPDFSLEL